MEISAHGRETHIDIRFPSIHILLNNEIIANYSVIKQCIYHIHTYIIHIISDRHSEELRELALRHGAVLFRGCGNNTYIYIYIHIYIQY